MFFQTKQEHLPQISCNSGNFQQVWYRMERLSNKVVMKKLDSSSLEMTKYPMLNFMIKAFKMNFKVQISQTTAIFEEYC